MSPGQHGWVKRHQAVIAAVLSSLLVACAARQPRQTEKSATRLALARDYLARGNFGAAAREARRALEYDDENERAHNMLGLVSLLEALRDYRLIEIDGCLTGDAADELRAELDQYLLTADEYFARAVAIAPDYGEAWQNRGTTALQLGRLPEAIRYFTEALKFPARLENVALTRANLGWAYFRADDVPRAAKELLQAAQFQPGMCLAGYRLGRVYFARKQWEKALAKFREVIDNKTACPIQEAHLYLMKTYLELGQKSGLEPLRNTCVALAPQSCVAAACRAEGSTAR
ncbi:MAG TPA: tetratricopeptide repeat protein [Kofleriaceae bacterium]|nr:tetratricopeptide repeat protein [Kofleriaceae bacterium]